MARYADVGLKERGYAPREGSFEQDLPQGKTKDLAVRRKPIPKFSDDEMYLRLGIPDGLLTGPTLEGIPHNPLTATGDEVMAAMKKKYGDKKGKEVFYASINKGVKGSDKWHQKR